MVHSVSSELKYTNGADERRVNYVRSHKKNWNIWWKGEPQHISALPHWICLRVNFTSLARTHTHIQTIKCNSSDSLEISMPMDLNGQVWSKLLARPFWIGALNGKMVPNPTKTKKHFRRKFVRSPRILCQSKIHKLWNAHKLKREKTVFFLFFFSLDFAARKYNNIEVNWIQARDIGSTATGRPFWSNQTKSDDSENQWVNNFLPSRAWACSAAACRCMKIHLFNYITNVLVFTRLTLLLLFMDAILSCPTALIEWRLRSDVQGKREYHRSNYGNESDSFQFSSAFGPSFVISCYLAAAKCRWCFDEETSRVAPPPTLIDSF